MTRIRSRLFVLHVLIVTLLAVLAVRLWQVQVVRGQEFVTRAAETRTRTVIVPAVRGQILDASGRPLVRNKTALVVSVDRTALLRTPDGGAEVLRVPRRDFARPDWPAGVRREWCAETALLLAVLGPEAGEDADGRAELVHHERRRRVSG